MEYSNLITYALWLSATIIVLTYAHALFHKIQSQHIRMFREIVRRLRNQSERTIRFCELMQDSLKETEEKLEKLEERV